LLEHRTEKCEAVFGQIRCSNKRDSEAIRHRSKCAAQFRKFSGIEVCLRDNCAVGIPRHPTSCSLATTNLADRVINSVQAALAELGAGFGMAEHGAIMSAADGVISGRDARRAARIPVQ